MYFELSNASEDVLPYSIGKSVAHFSFSLCMAGKKEMERNREDLLNLGRNRGLNSIPSFLLSSYDRNIDDGYGYSSLFGREG